MRSEPNLRFSFGLSIFLDPTRGNFDVSSTHSSRNRHSSFGDFHTFIQIGYSEEPSPPTLEAFLWDVHLEN